MLGNTIRDLRKERGWNQGQLAVRAEVHENYVWGVENGLRNVSAINLLYFASAFGVHPSELWRGFKAADLKRLPEKSAARLRAKKTAARER